MIAELPERELVLLGAGHTHLHILRMWQMHPLPGVRLTCVSNGSRVSYSGMLPGTLAGQYAPEEMQIDLVRRCAAVGARLILAETTGLDRAGKHLLLRDRPPLAYDFLSIGIGSRPAAVAGLQHALSIKPMPSFTERLERRLGAIAGSSSRPLRVAIVGGGAGGVEIAFCIAPLLRRRFPGRALELTLVDRGSRLLAGASRGAVRCVRRLLAQRGWHVRLGCSVTEVTEDALIVQGAGDPETRLPADVVIWAASAVGPALFSEFDLPQDGKGFLLTNTHLQSSADPAIFVVGDSGTCAARPHPKAGVYAVRQGPVLWDNLRSACRGQPLREWQPQRRFLSLLNTGDGRAVLDYRGLAIHHRGCWRLKDRIDRNFLRKHQNYQPAGMPPDRHRRAAKQSSGGDDPMRCAGCGGKLPGTVLQRALARLENPTAPHVRLGLREAEDVAAVDLRYGSSVIATTDFFTAFLDDPYTVGRVAALNALSDLFAKGASATAALAHAVIPGGPESQQEGLLFELLAGGLAELRPLGVPIVGGHSIEGEQTVLGFTLLGEPPAAAELRLKDGLRAGDFLVLTKPLGTGVLLAAHRQARCAGAWFETLVACMLKSNQPAAVVADEFQLRAATDVTGFGLMGHLIEMLRGSELAATIDLRAVPLLPGAETLLRAGIESSLAEANRAAEAEVQAGGVAAQQSGAYQALFDPQTSGGLLLGVPEEKLGAVLERLRRGGCSPAVIGRACDRFGSGLRVGWAEHTVAAATSPG